MQDWWKQSVVYEIYIKSFQDSNQDGLGDLRGIIQRLDYLKALNVDVLWLTPIYNSPNDDNGYDISDYRSIMKEYGNMQDFEELLEKAHEKGLKIVMDLVVNHTSDEHVWFQKSKAQDKQYEDYYIWRDANPDGTPPNNWTNCFLGSAWEWDATRQQYYLHMFSKKQPDLNWSNPAVRDDVYDMMNWWLTKGIDGFRMDVITLISKDEAMLHANSPIKGHTVCANGPLVHDYLKEMRQKVLVNYDAMSVGEAPAATVETARLYANKNHEELDMVFQFELMDVDGGESGKWNDTHYQLCDVKKVLSKWQHGLHDQAWNSLFWNNHDQPRVVSRFGNTTTTFYWEKSAKMLATALYLLQGTPYIYQGEELGMCNVAFPDIKDYRDIESLQAYDFYVKEEGSITHEDMMRYLLKASRDNARTPMQWSDEANAGFSEVDPWIMVSPDYHHINAKQQEQDETSILHYYQTLLGFRKQDDIITHGSYEDIMTEHPFIYAYKRLYKESAYLVLCNFSKEVQSYQPSLLEGYSRLFGNYEQSTPGVLEAYEAVVYKK